ncbi:MAG: Asp23/Gls24 family envelope stress response protein [Candidatus Omnitrophota bacterium]
MIEKKRKMTDVGDVKVHNDAIVSITKITISKISGVVRINKSAFKNFLEIIGADKMLNIADGIRVVTTENGTKIALDIVVAYGADISELASRVQDEVRQAVERMTGITSVEVDVNVTGVEPDTGGSI